MDYYLQTIINGYCRKSVKSEEDVIINYKEEYFEEEYLEEYEDEAMPMSFIDPNISRPETPILKTKKLKSEEKVEVELVTYPYPLPEAILDHTYTDNYVASEVSDSAVAEQTFDGNYSSDDNVDQSDDERTKKTVVRVDNAYAGKPLRHKIRQLTGKPACKYCDTIFKTKESLKMHVCEYLQCDPKNFVCRICRKELSKKTFSNHLHETLDCQYCKKKFVNPRNMKTHIKNVHKNEKFIPPNPPNREMFEQFQNLDEPVDPLLDETTGIMVTQKPPRKKYPRKKGRFECGKCTNVCFVTDEINYSNSVIDLCGRIFTTVRSLKIHMDLHTSE